MPLAAKFAPTGRPPSRADRVGFWLWGTSVMVLGLAWVWAHGPQGPVRDTASAVLSSELFWMAFAVGLAAQLIDGALGMAYGLSANTFLISLCATPAAASGAVHLAEMVTTAASGTAHARLGHVRWRWLLWLAAPGVVGALIGAYALTQLDVGLIKPLVALYLLAMGLWIVYRALGRGGGRSAAHPLQMSAQPPRSRALALGLTGGTLDAIGGGGWGSVVASNLLARGADPRQVIGTVNAAEFFVASASGLALLAWGAVQHGYLVAGLMAGGVLAAPLAAWATGRVPVRALLGVVGALISALASYSLYSAIGPFLGR